MAKTNGAHLGALLYLTNQVTVPNSVSSNFNPGGAMARVAPSAPPLAIEPRKVSRAATVYAVFAIE